MGSPLAQLTGRTFNEGAWEILRVEGNVLTIRRAGSPGEWKALFSLYVAMDGPPLEPLSFGMQKVGVGEGYYLLTPH